MVFVRPRSRPGSPAGGVRHRSRRRSRRLSQSTPTSSACAAGRLRRPTGAVSHRRASSHVRTHVRRAGVDGVVTDGQGPSSPDRLTMTWAQRRALLWIEAYRARIRRPPLALPLLSDLFELCPRGVRAPRHGAWWVADRDPPAAVSSVRTERIRSGSRADAERVRRHHRRRPPGRAVPRCPRGRLSRCSRFPPPCCRGSTV